MRRKRGASTETIGLDNVANALEDVQTVNQPVHAGLKLLASAEFVKETRGYESEPEDDEHEKSFDALNLEDTPDVNKVSKKRKPLKKLQGSK